jgi:hypothetical protein
MELYTGRTLVDIGLGEVGHRRIKLCHVPPFCGRLRKHLYMVPSIQYRTHLAAADGEVCDNTSSNFSGLSPKSTLVQ